MDIIETKSKKACLGCPFRRINTNEKPNPGGSHPFVYLGQARGPFWLPCHNDKNYDGKQSSPDKVTQCRGAAIFRSNCDSGIRLPKQLLSLEKDTNEVFANEAEFTAHYLDISVEAAAKHTTESNLNCFMENEMNSGAIRKHKVEKK